MADLPVLTPRQVVRALARAGFAEVRQKGSHLLLRKNELRVTVPMHRKELKRGTLRAIIKQAGMTVEEFVALL